MKTHPQRSRGTALVLSLLLVSATLYAQSRPQARGVAHRPKLIVLIIIDQFRQDYLFRFRPFFGNGGFRRFLDEGAVFTNCFYSYAQTLTAPGHATLATGAVPAAHGIIGNEWFDRGSGEIVTSVTDRSRRLVGTAGRGASPQALIGTTFADQLRLSTNFRSKVVGLSLKDRGAILPAGKSGNLALWFDSRSGQFITSDYYVQELPPWVAQFNAAKPADKYFGARWEKGFPAAVYMQADADDRPYEGVSAGGTRTFPHVITGGLNSPGPAFYDALTATPFANDLLVDLAQAAIKNEHLGEDDDPDLLIISFSANDIAGHTYGPFSQEVADLTLRTDQTLARLFSSLDRRFGPGGYIAALSADHGVSPIPEFAAAHKLGGRRIAPGAVIEAVQQHLRTRFGDEKWIDPRAEFLVAAGMIYLNREAISKRNLDPAVVERAAAEAAQTVPGVAASFTRTDLLAGHYRHDRLGAFVANGFHPERSGDVILVTEPLAIFWRQSAGTTHGSPHTYDTHVPLLLFGTRIKPGTYATPCTPADLAPTLAALLEIEVPTSVTGRVLHEALKE